MFSVVMIMALVLATMVGPKGPQGHFVIAQDNKFSIEDYYKINTGSTFIYKRVMTMKDDNGTVIVKTLKSEVTKSTAKSTYYDTVGVHFDGVYLVIGTVNGDDIVPNARILKANMKPGDTWELSAIETSVETKATFVGYEKLEVGAGKFDTVHLKFEYDGQTTHYWYAAKVGLVKTTMDSDSFSGVQTLEKYTLK